MLRFLLFTCIFSSFLLLISCTKQENTGQPDFTFKGIVGNYIGHSELCLLPVLTSDTICNSKNENTLRIIVADLSNISVEDFNAEFGKQKLRFVEKSSAGQKTIHTFTATTEEFQFRLFWTSPDNTILLERLRIKPDNSELLIFVGVR
ncbi:MAG: hypothetical protein IPM42_03815 [Saprospiraceae bacterium]|nr:hypothetical protein [Saprospiraceae bacterium]